MKRTMAKTTSRTVMIAITARALPSQSVGCFRGGGSTSGAPDPRPSAESRSVSAAMRSFTASLRSVIAASRSRSASSISPLALSRCLSAASRSRVSRSISVSRSRVNPLALAATSACSDRAVSSWRMASSRSGISCSRSPLAASRSRSACSRSRRAAASSLLATASSLDRRVCSASAASRLAVSAAASWRSSSASTASRLECFFSSASRSDTVRLRVGRGRSGARSTTMLGATASSAWPGSGEPPFHGNAATQSVPSSAAQGLCSSSASRLRSPSSVLTVSEGRMKRMPRTPDQRPVTSSRSSPVTSKRSSSNATRAPFGLTAKRVPSAAMSRSLRVLPDALAAGLIGLAIFAWFGHAFLNYDTSYSLVWGSDLANGRTPDYKVPVAPTPHPLAMLVGVPASLFGHAGEGVMLAIVLFALGFLVVGIYRLGVELFSWPVGLLAALIVLTRQPFLNYGIRGYVDLVVIALVIWAAVLEARRPRRGWPVLVLLGLAGLLRPEAWLFLVVYWLWLFPSRSWRERVGLG